MISRRSAARAAEIGAEQRAPARRPAAVAQREANAVADETHEAFAGRGVHDGSGLRHFLFHGWLDGVTIPQTASESNTASNTGV